MKDNNKNLTHFRLVSKTFFAFFQFHKKTSFFTIDCARRTKAKQEVLALIASLGKQIVMHQLEKK
jgi:hypothetical protein